MSGELKQKIETVVARANFVVRKDIACLLEQACNRETDSKAKKALLWIIENSAKAAKKSLAICQDTGLPIVFIEIGSRDCLKAKEVSLIEKYVEDAYKRCCLRPSLVDPLVRGRPSYKGIRAKLSFINAQRTRITVMPKGFGCENKTTLKMFNPTVSIDEIESFIVDSVTSAGPEACPPFFVGVGIGGTSDSILLLAKKSLLDDMRRVNKDKMLSGMERRILKKINASRIGAMGLGGMATALAVKIKKETTHIAGLPVGVSISCHALRSATVIL